MKYWIIKDGQSCGPFEREQLKENGLTPESKVWRQALPQWTTAARLRELNDLTGFGVSPQPQPQSQPSAVPSMPFSDHMTATIVTTVLTVLCFVNMLAFINPFFYIAALLAILAFRSVGKTRRLWHEGDEEAARKQAERTVTFLVINVVVALVGIPFSLVGTLFLL